MRYLFTFIMLLLVTVVHAADAPCLPPPTITGNEIVSPGVANWYSLTQAFIATPSWSFASGTGTINSSYSSGNTYYVSVSWTTSGTLYFYDEVTQIEASKNVTVVGAPTVTGASRCGPGTATLSATMGTGGTKVRWYAAPTGGSVLSEANNYTTSSLTTTTTYWVQTYNHLFAAGSDRVPVSGTVVTIPSEPDSVTGDERCGKGELTLLATADTTLNTIVWYTSPVGGDTVHMGTSFTTTVTTPTAYYAASYNVAAECVSQDRVMVMADAKVVPAVTVWYHPIMFGTGQTELNTYAYTLGRAPSTPRSAYNPWLMDIAGELVDIDLDTTLYEIAWYDSETDAEEDVSRLATSPVFTTPVINETTTYYVRIYNTDTGCGGDVTEAVAKVTPLVTTASVRTDVLRVAGKKTNVAFNTLTDSEKTTSFSYLDGLGRVQQTTVLRGSPSGQDIVMPYEYDALGRVAKSYLPYTDTTTTGVFHSGFKLEQQKFFLVADDKIADDSVAYAVSVYEESPRGLVLEQGNVGKGFQPGQGHSSHAEYSLNTSTDYVRKFDGKGNSTTWHPAKALTKTTGTDAEDNHTITFTDGTGRTVLVRQWIDASVEGTYTDYLETYYIYNDLGQVTFIVSPKGVAELKANSWTFSSTIKDSYCNQFKYDSKGRVIEKKVPGQAWQYIIYDPLDRMVLTQDGLLRPDNKWMFIKYDLKGNPVMSGIHTNTTYTTRSTLQAYVDGIYVSGHGTFGADVWYEKQGSTLHGYTSQSFPNANIDVLSVNYFDDYDFDNSGTADTVYVSAGITGEHTPATYSLGRATGGKRKILGTSTWLFTYVFYDDRGRTIQVRSTNPLNTNRLDRVTNAYADDGRVLYSKKLHNVGSGLTKSILNKYEYTTRGDLWKVSQDNGGTGSAYQLVVQYEYNELGQLVDKKLHNTGGSDFLQSVDYRYTIRGQLKSINNSELSSNSANDETNDYFGMELLYDETESGLTTDNRYDGSISAMKWKSIGDTIGVKGLKSYAYSYDKTGRLETASYAKKESSWDKEIGAQNEAMTYDHNGNIKTLKRKQREYGWGTTSAAYTAHTIDSLAYSYTSGDKNSLKKIEDAADPTGFTNGINTATEYRYDINGNLTSDKNKGIDSIYYNFLGKPERMDFADGKKIEYTYDAAGMKLTQKLYSNDTLKTTTHYVNGFVYVADTTASPVLSFFGSPEGRVVNNSGTLEYEYSIADHQGNTRVVFTSATPAADDPLATFEGTGGDEASQYLNVSVVTSFAANHTPSGSKVVRMNQSYRVGPARSIKVYPGDQVEAEVWAYYESASGYGTSSPAAAVIMGAVASVFGGVSAGGGESGLIYNGVDEAFGMFGLAGNQGDDTPAAYLNYILFDKHYNVLDMGWQPVTDASSWAKAKVEFEETIQVKEEGYVYIYLSYENESNNYVYFDDLKVTHTKTNVIQYNEYYPFGLQTSTSWTRENSKENQSLYNAGSELNKTSGWYEMYYRGYDPAIGRMLQVDPYAPMYASVSTYNYAINNPVMMNDPSGGQVDATGLTNSQLRGLYLANRWRDPGTGDFSDWASDNVTGTSLDGGYFGSAAGGRWGTFEYRYYYADGVEAEWKRHVEREWVPDRNSDTYIGMDLDIYWTDEHLFVEGDPKRKAGATSLNFRKSRYDDKGNIVLFFDIRLASAMQCDPFVATFGADFWKKVLAHEYGHVMQLMDIVSSPNFTFNGVTGSAADILAKSGLEGDALEQLFVDMMSYAESKWIDKKRYNAIENDANKRAAKLFPNIGVSTVDPTF